MLFPKFLTMSLFFPFFISSLASSQPSSSTQTKDVCSYYEARVAFLLRCCGDTEIGYDGPRFPSYPDASARTAAAVNEAEIGLKRCEPPRSPQYVSLLLDKIGAELESAATLLEVGGHSSKLGVVSAHANEAARELQIVLDSYPRVAVRLWPWLTHALIRAGRPLDALRFLSSLGSGCCDLAMLNRIRGDVLFILKAEAPAAAEYSSWLSLGKSQCGSEISLANVSYLRSKGFEISDTGASLNSDHAICGATDEWHPYVRLSVEYMR